MSNTIKMTELVTIIKNDIGIGSKKLILVVSDLVWDSGLRLMLSFRIGKYLYSKSCILLKIISMFIKYRYTIKYGCNISYNAEIGNGVKLIHPNGIVIGENVIIGDNVKIWQQVTLGSIGNNSKEKVYPAIESNVKIYAGAKVLGNIIIGRNSVIGANAVVIKDVPPDSVSIGVPAYNIKKNHEKIY